MGYKKTVTSILPSENLLHLFQSPEGQDFYNGVVTITRAYRDNIISYEKYKDSTTVITKTVFESKEICDEIDSLFLQMFPDYHTIKDEYHRTHGISFTVEHENC